jgi:hypothetical protein
MKRLLVLLSLVLLSSCASTPPVSAQPEWVSKRQDARYSPDLYWIGVSSAVGSNADQKAAEAAKKEIAAQFKVRVNATTTFIKTENTNGKNSEFSQSLTEKIQNIVENVELTGVQIAETHKEGIRVHALAVLNKEEFWRPRRDELKAYRARAAEKSKSASSFAATDIGTALNAYLETLDLIDEMTPKAEFYNMLAPDKFVLPNELQPESIEKEMRATLGEIRVKAASGNGQTDEVGKTLDKPLVVRAETKTGTPLRGLPVLFTVGETELAKIKTDEKGEASYSFVVNADGASGTKGQVFAGVDMTKLSPNMQKELRANTTAAFAYTIKTVPFVCALQIDGIDDGSAEQTLKKKLSDALQKNGATFKGGAAMIVKASVSSSGTSSVQGMNGEILIREILTNVSFQTKSGDALSSFTISTKSIGKTEDEAVSKAMSELKIPSAKLAESIGKAKSATP